VATTTKTTWTWFTPTSAAERARREAAIAQFEQAVAPGIMNGPMPIDVNIAVASREVGLASDTTGGMFEMLFQAGGTSTTAFAVGLGAASLTYHDRTLGQIVDDGSTLSTMRVAADLSYRFYGFPIRVTQVIANRMSVVVQWDLNVIAVTDTAASPFTLSLLYKLPILTVKGTASTDRFDARSTNLGLEMILGF